MVSEAALLSNQLRTQTKKFRFDNDFVLPECLRAGLFAHARIGNRAKRSGGLEEWGREAAFGWCLPAMVRRPMRNNPEKLVQVVRVVRRSCCSLASAASALRA